MNAPNILEIGKAVIPLLLQLVTPQANQDFNNKIFKSSFFHNFKRVLNWKFWACF